MLRHPPIAGEMGSPPDGKRGASRGAADAVTVMECVQSSGAFANAETQGRRGVES
jgi:hypothetical protein